MRRRVCVELEEVVFGCDDEDGSLVVLVLAPVRAQRIRVQERAARGGRVKAVRSPRKIACILGRTRIYVK